MPDIDNFRYYVNNAIYYTIQVDAYLDDPHMAKRKELIPSVLRALKKAHAYYVLALLHTDNKRSILLASRIMSDILADIRLFEGAYD
jgi:hypothetical protein